MQTKVFYPGNKGALALTGSCPARTGGERSLEAEKCSRIRGLIVMVALLLVPSTLIAEANFFAAEEHGVPNQYIVTLANDMSLKTADEAAIKSFVEQRAARLAKLYGGKVERTFPLTLRGFQIRMSEGQAQRLAYDPAVKRVSQDHRIAFFEPMPPNCYGRDASQSAAQGDQILAPEPLSPQTITCDDPDPRNPNRNCPDNWGLDRIDQVGGMRDGQYHFNATGSFAVDVYVLDTGIDRFHDEFSIVGSPVKRVTQGYNAVLGGSEAANTDCHGHGTHVAAIIGGLNVGVAKSVWLHPIKFAEFCDSQNRGSNLTDVINGLKWVRDNHDVMTDGPAVINWSGGNGSAVWPVYDNPDLQEVVRQLLDAGISFVQSAGNQNDSVDGEDACDRSLGGIAELDEVIVVGGADTNQGENPPDGRWIREMDDPSYSHCEGVHKDCGSNSGACVDIWAPAAHIVSAHSNDDLDPGPSAPDSYCRLSGTSMAAPHVTGTVALYLEQQMALGVTPTPSQVKQALIAGATYGQLDDDPASPYYIGDGSPNLLLNSLLNGGGPGTAPIAVDDSFTTPRDTKLGITFGALLANDTHDGNWSIVYDLTSSAGGWNDTGHLGGFNYTPPVGFTGLDSFNYTLTDSSGLSSTATVRVTVNLPESGPFLQDGDSDGIVSIEAEHFHSNVAGEAHNWAASSTAGASGGEAMRAAPDAALVDSSPPRLDFSVNFVKTGTHYVWVRGWAPNGGGNSVHSGLDAPFLPTSDRIQFVSYRSWSWSKATMDGVDANFDVATTGEHTFSLTMREDGFIADKILLTTNPAFVPTGFGPAESPRGSAPGPFRQDSGYQGIVSIEAENFDSNVAGEAHTWVANSTVGASGGDAMKAAPDAALVDSSPPRLDFSVNFVKTGTHYVWVRGWAPNGGGNSVHSGLDAPFLPTSDRIQFVSYRSWSWSKATMDGVDANFDVATTGEHTFSLTMREDGFIADKIVLTTDSTYVPTGVGPVESPRN